MEPSANVMRALDGPRPRMRGLLHRWGAAALLFVGGGAIMRAGPGAHRAATALYVVASVAMLAASAGMHWRRRNMRETELWIRIDHTGIHLMIPAAVTAVAWLGLGGWLQAAVIWSTWVIALAGLAIEWRRKATPRGFAHGAFLVNGWLGAAGVWGLWQSPEAGPSAVAWLLAGGLVYTVGAILLARRQPDPWPGVFGYHEVWHALVLVALACHLWLIAVVLRPGP